MPTLLDAAYLAALTASAPWLALGKRRRPLWPRLAGRVTLVPSTRPVAWFHGVSVGEIHLLGPLVRAFRQRFPDWQPVVSATTAAGHAEAVKRFADAPVLDWPLDFSWAAARALDAVRPSLLVLAEAELWPQTLLAARRRGVPVAVVNARMSPRSFARWRRLGPLARRLFGLVDHFAAQTDEYADHLRRLGVPAGRVSVTGSVKFDNVTADRDNPRTRGLRELFGVAPGDLVLVAGSTQAPEEELALGVFRRARADHPTLRLVLVPRTPERFDAVADLVARSGLAYVRRSRLTAPAAGRPAVVLLDTVGELSAAWGLADVAFVGGSLDGKRGGQNMIEPAAYGCPVVFGPHVWNFRDPARRLVGCGAAVQVNDGRELGAAVRRLLADADARRAAGDAGRRLVASQQGATGRTLDALAALVGAKASRAA